MIYLLVFFMMILVSAFSISKLKMGNLPYYLILLFIILIAGLRFRVGGDTIGYFDKFHEIPTLNKLSKFDFSIAEYNPSWYIFNALLKSISDSFYVFQLGHAILINVIIFWFFRKYSYNKFFVLPFYFFFYFVYFNMEILRESLSIGIFLLAIPSFLKKNWFRYYIFVLVGLTFHTSAIVAAILPILYSNLKVRYQIILFGLLTAFLGFFVNGNFISSLGIENLLGTNTLYYLNKQMNLTGVLYQLLKILPVVLIYAFSKKINSTDRFEKFVFPFAIIGVISAFIPGVYRFLNYLVLPILVYLTNQLYFLILNKKLYIKTYYKVSLSVFILFVFQIYYYMRDESEVTKVNGTKKYDSYLPYYSIFEEKFHEKRELYFYRTLEGGW